MRRLCAAIGFVLLGASIAAQSGARNGEWRSYAGDVGSTRYSPLDQIDAANFSKLEIAWRFKTDSLGPRPEYQFEGTPLMANGIVYSTDMIEPEPYQQAAFPGWHADWTKGGVNKGEEVKIGK